jgi:hypothetical protein
MTDIFALWKTNRFIVADTNILELNEILVLLTDYKFWGQQHIADQLLIWCNEYECEIKGMTVLIPNKETLTVFMLKWA